MGLLALPPAQTAEQISIAAALAASLAAAHLKRALRQRLSTWVHFLLPRERAASCGTSCSATCKASCAASRTASTSWEFIFPPAPDTFPRLDPFFRAPTGPVD